MGRNSPPPVHPRVNSQPRGSAMRSRVRFAATIAIAALPLLAGAQTQITPSAADLAQKNFLPIGPPSPLPSSRVPDLSGDWALGLGGIGQRRGARGPGGGGQSLSAADPGGRARGKEPDNPYKPWALAYTMAQVPPTGPDA